MKRMLIIFGVFFVVFNAGQALAQPLVRVNINKADVKQLVSLKGIGEKKAEAIIADRKHHGVFHSVNDLTRIQGIGQRFLERLLHRNSGRIVTKSR